MKYVVKKIVRLFEIVALSVLVASFNLEVSYADDGSIHAFPGAVGRGAISQGGRGGDVYHVTNLQDDKSGKIPGSLRYGLEKAKEHTTIVFDVGGIIHLQARLKVRKSYLTIAGQTAPGEGITLAGYPLDIGKDCPVAPLGQVYYSGSCGKSFGFTDIIIRYVRFRPGDFNARGVKGHRNANGIIGAGNGNGDLGGDGGDAIFCVNSERIIFDHVSASWSMDEAIDLAWSSNVTIQNSIVSEGLLNSFKGKPHSRTFLTIGFDKISDINQGKGGYTLYRNLLAHSNMRNPLVGGYAKYKKTKDSNGKTKRTKIPLTAAELSPTNPDALFQRMDFINNVVYDWGERSGHTGRGNILLNYVNNYLISGPSTKSSGTSGGGNNSGVAMREENDDESTFHIYHAGNYMDLDKDGNHDGNPALGSAFAGFEPGEVKSQPLSFMMSGFISAQNSYTSVLADAGASLHRDAVDARIVNEVKTRKGKIIDSQYDVNGLDNVLEDAGILGPTSSTQDADRDGMPDSWETANGLNPGNASDRNGKGLSAVGYTNLEVYLSSLVRKVEDDKAPGIPANLNASNITQTSVTLNWSASTDNVGVAGYEIFQNNAKVKTVAGTTATLTNLTTNVNYSFRVRAKDAAGNLSAFSNSETAVTDSSPPIDTPSNNILTVTAGNDKTLTCAKIMLTLAASSNSSQTGIYSWSTNNGNIISDPRRKNILIDEPGAYTITVNTGNQIATDTVDVSKVCGDSPVVEKITVIYQAETGGSIVGEANQIIEKGSSGSAVNAVPDKGYRFVDWSDLLSASNRTDSNVTENITLTARFVKVADDALPLKSSDSANSDTDSSGGGSLHPAGLSLMGLLVVMRRKRRHKVVVKL